MPTTHLKQLLNPYPGDQSSMTRIQAWVDPADKYLLHSVYPIKGVETYMLAGIYKAVAADIRAHNITFFTPENATTVHEIITRHLAPAQPLGGGPSVHVPRAANSRSKQDSPAADKPANVRKGRKG